MKNTIITRLILTATLFAVTSMATHATFIKEWNYGYTGNYFQWAFKFRDQWNGDNYQCILPGSDCGRFDWRAVYYGSCGSVPTPENSNTAEYGDYLVRKQAVVDGIILPSDLGLPTFTIAWEDCGSGN